MERTPLAVPLGVRLVVVLTQWTLPGHQGRDNGELQVRDKHQVSTTSGSSAQPAWLSGKVVCLFHCLTSS